MRRGQSQMFVREVEMFETASNWVAVKVLRWRERESMVGRSATAGSEVGGGGAGILDRRSEVRVGTVG